MRWPAKAAPVRRRRRCAGAWPRIACLALLVTTCSPGAVAKDQGLVVETNFAVLVGQMRTTGLPLMLLVSQSDCPYCERLKDEVLNPMLISGEYVDKIILREVFVEAGEEVVDFDGKSSSVQAFAGRYRAWVSPTLLFLDAAGNEITKRIIGYQTSGFFPYDVDESIRVSGSRLREGRN